MAHARNAQDVSTLLRGWCTCVSTCGAAAWDTCCLRQPAWLHGTRCFDTALAHRLQMPIVSSRGGDGNSPAAPTVRLVYVCWGIGTAGRRLVQVQLAGGTTWALPPSAGKCTQHTVWGRAGKAGKGRKNTRAQASECFGHACPLVLVRVGPAKKRNAQDVLLLQQVCHPCSNGEDVASILSPQITSKGTVRRAPNASASCFCSGPSKYFLHQVYITAWLHNTATHRSRRPWRECVIGSFAAAAVRQGLGRASLRGDAVH